MKTTKKNAATKKNTNNANTCKCTGYHASSSTISCLEEQDHRILSKANYYRFYGLLF